MFRSYIHLNRMESPHVTRNRTLLSIVSECPHIMRTIWLPFLQEVPRIQKTTAHATFPPVLPTRMNVFPHSFKLRAHPILETKMTKTLLTLIIPVGRAHLLILQKRYVHPTLLHHQNHLLLPPFFHTLKPNCLLLLLLLLAKFSHTLNSIFLPLSEFPYIRKTSAHLSLPHVLPVNSAKNCHRYSKGRGDADAVFAQHRFHYLPH